MGVVADRHRAKHVLSDIHGYAPRALPASECFVTFNAVPPCERLNTGRVR